MPFFFPPSLHPLYTDKDVVFEPALLGTGIIEEEDGLMQQKLSAAGKLCIQAGDQQAFQTVGVVNRQTNKRR